MHDFGWLLEIGNPFVVFDKQDSGNLCFGVEKNYHKLFVKYAGAKTIEFSGNAVDAICRLKSAIQAYIDLSHEVLIAYKYSFETPKVLLLFLNGLMVRICTPTGFFLHLQNMKTQILHFTNSEDYL